MKEKLKKQTILIAMTGGVESTVAAYLLKKQGYICIGIGLQLFEPGENPGPFADAMVSDLNKVKAICSYLDIPFYAVNASDAFKDLVLDPAIGRILSGHTFEPMAFLNLALMDILLLKMEKFKASYIATGHYAKILKNQKTNSFELMVANDLKHDQSYFLSRLRQEHFENLIFPLSEIRKSEVLKIGELIKVEYLQRPKTHVQHIMNDPRMMKLVEDRSPKDLRRTGSIYDYRSESSICEHVGIHQYYIGQKNISSPGETVIDPFKEVISIIPYKGNVFIDYPDRLKYSHAFVSRFIFAAKLNTTLPMSVYVKMSYVGEKIPCCLYFKNNNTCLVDFENERPGVLIGGQLFVFYSRSGEKGKVIGSAIVDIGGVFAPGEYNTLPKNKKDKSDEDEEEKKSKDDEKLHF